MVDESVTDATLRGQSREGGLRTERNAWRNLATARASILAAYRTHRQPPGWALDMAHRARTDLERMEALHE